MEKFLKFCRINVLAVLAVMVAFAFHSDVVDARAKKKKKYRKSRGGGIYALYQNPIAGLGQCLPISTNSKTVLARNRIETPGASASERAALAKGITQIERLLGNKPLPKSWRTNFNFIRSRHPKTGKYTWNQGASAIFIRRPKGTSTLLTGRMMHELGHKIGHQGHYSAYRKFTKGQRCRITPYCSAKANEEFAEAFEAFVTVPHMLKKSCPKAYAYFSTKMFPKSKGQIASCVRLNGKTVPGKSVVSDAVK